MPDRPTCKDCRFWDSGTNIGICRARAPVAGPHIHGEDAQAMWPRTEETDWCGEHEPHDSDAKAPKLKTEYIEGAGWVTNNA